jgi:hypothetical protein
MVATPNSFQSIAEILSKQRTVLPPNLSRPAAPQAPASVPRPPSPDNSRYELNLAEFPFFVLSTRSNRLRELSFSGTYKDAQTNEQVPFTWQVQPSIHGLPGPFEQHMFFVLLQIWWEQGLSSQTITYGSSYRLLQRMGVTRKHSERDYKSVIRGFERLVGATIRTENCFYDVQTKRRVSVLWHPFTRAFYYPDEFKAQQRGQTMLPFASVQVDELFLDIARNSGFLELSFGAEYYQNMTPLQRRYGVYLSKLLRLQSVHVRSFEDLIKLGPIEAKRPRRARQTLNETLDGLLDLKLPLLGHYDTFRSGNQDYFRFFSTRTQRAKKRAPTPQEEFALERIIQAVGSPTYANLWLRYIRQFGPGSVDRALGLLRDSVAAYKQRGIRFNAGKILKKIFDTDLKR